MTKIFLLLLLFLTAQLSAQPDREAELRRALADYGRDMGVRTLTLKDSVKVNILVDLAAEIYENKPGEAMQLLEKSLVLARSIKFDRQLGIIYNMQGAINDSYSKYSDALENYRAAIRENVRQHDRSALLRTYFNIGVMYGKQANFPEALSYMIKGLEIAKSIKDHEALFGGYNNLGVLYTQQGNLDLSLKYYLNALGVLEKLGKTYYMGMLSQNIGDIFLLKKEFAKAEQYFEQGLKQSVESGNRKAEANNYYGFGRSGLLQGDYSGAIENLQKSLEIRTAMDDQFGIAEAHIGLGQAYIRAGAYHKARTSLEKGLSLVRKSGEMSLEQDAYEHLSEVSRLLGDYRSAYEYQTLFRQTTDSIFNKEKDRKIVQIQLEHEFRAAQDSLKVVQQARSRQLQDEAREQKEMRNFIYIVLVIVVLFLVVLLWQNRHIAKVKRQQVLDEQRHRISRDLHDNLGAQLSAARMFMVSLCDQQSVDVQQTANSSIGLLDASIADLRNIMDEMQDTVLIEKGYLAATEALINKVNKLNGIEFSLTHHRMEERLAARTEHQLYRVTQELVNNTLKYSRASAVSIDLLKGADALVLMYEDDGVGYNAKTVKKGYGLRNIETRIKSIGGKVNFDSMPQTGARTTIEIPQ